jgi:hypothetical protein
MGRRLARWQAQPNPIHMAIAHHIHFPQAEATINVLSPRAPRHYQSAKHRYHALVGYRS